MPGCSRRTGGPGGHDIGRGGPRGFISRASTNQFIYTKVKYSAFASLYTRRHSGARRSCVFVCSCASLRVRVRVCVRVCARVCVPPWGIGGYEYIPSACGFISVRIYTTHRARLTSRPYIYKDRPRSDRAATAGEFRAQTFLVHAYRAIYTPRKVRFDGGEGGFFFIRVSSESPSPPSIQVLRRPYSIAAVSGLEPYCSGPRPWYMVQTRRPTERAGANRRSETASFRLGS